MNKKHRDLKLSETAFSVMKDNYHDKWEEYEHLYNSIHTKEFVKLAKEQERSHLFIPIAKSTIDILDSIFAEAFLGSGNPIEITKNEDDEANVAATLNTLVKHYYKLAKPYSSLTMAFSSMSRFGLGAVLPYWDKDRELPITKFIPATKIAFDTEALTRDENKYVSHRFKQTKQDIVNKVKNKFYDKISKKDLSKILGSKYNSDEQKYKRILVTEVYSVKSNGKYICRTFIKDTLVREAKFKKLAIKHGYLTSVLPTIVESDQEDQCACVGESVLEVIKELVKELNQKRNQVIDIHEQLIDPLTHVGDDAEIDPEDAGKIKGVINVGNPKEIKRYSPTSTYSIEKDLALLSQDIDDATAINGMQRGQTSSSDRRAAAAMAMINANSSARLSRMATTANDTMFNDWAEAFVRDIYINVPNKIVLELCGEKGLSALGLKGSRLEIDYLVNVNFGQSINREAKISELTMLLQMLNGREDADIMPILVEVLKLILGDNFDENTIFKRVLGDGRDSILDGNVQEKEGDVARSSGVQTRGEAQAGATTISTSPRGSENVISNQSASARNQI